MIRLTLLLALLALTSCRGKHAEPPFLSRYEAVKATVDSSSRWCDTNFTGPAPRLGLPPLAPAPVGRAWPTLTKGKRTWVNLWATWCQPCLREIPLLLKWQDDLRKDGVDVDVLLLSIDEDGAALDRLLAGRRELQAAKVARVANQNDYERWVKAFVKDPLMPIPIHLLASADGDVRCVRSGSLREGDYPAARAVLSDGRNRGDVY